MRRRPGALDTSATDRAGQAAARLWCAHYFGPPAATRRPGRAPARAGSWPSELQQTLNLLEHHVGDVLLKIMPSRQGTSGHLGAVPFPDPEHVVEPAHRPLLGPQDAQRNRDLLLGVDLVPFQID